MQSVKTVHVAVGVILRNSKVLLAKRANHQHQGGLWEFPGGKVELGETVEKALVRELKEELAITATHLEPLIKIRHDYGDKCVLLDVWTVLNFTGDPQGCEGQPLEWVAKKALSHYAFPAANAPIVKAITLPSLIAITPAEGSVEDLIGFATNAKQKGAQAIQLRCPHLSNHDVIALYHSLSNLLEDDDFTVILNSMHCLGDAALTVDAFAGLKALHIRSEHYPDWKLLQSEPSSSTYILYGACHSAAQLQQASSLGIDAAILSPIKQTVSHPGAPNLGWAVFSQLIENIALPVYALGGLSFTDMAAAKQCYAQGIAGISLFESDD